MKSLFAAQGGTSALSTSFTWFGGYGTFSVRGTFKGGTCSLRVNVSTSTSAAWQSVGTDVTFTSSGVGNFTLPVCELGALITGASSANTSISAVIL